MNRNVRGIALSLGTLVLGCSTDAKDPPASAAPAAPSSVEDAVADAETGRDVAATRTRLEALVVDTSLPKSDHAKIALALSRLVESSDHERAVTLAEDAVASGGENADRRLFALLTGAKPPSPYRRGPIVPASAFARALTKYFPAATSENAVEVKIHRFGGSDEGGPWPSGTYDVGAALRDIASEACGFCDDPKTSIHTSSSRLSSWAMIPSALGELERSLVVTYVDAEMLPPARYEKWFAASIAEMKSAFDLGQGLVAVKERPGAPPLVTIAAPRVAQLPLVEAKLAAMDELPLSARRVDVPAPLTRDEIRMVIRSRWGAFRRCYDELATRKPAAEGTLELAFSITGDGATKDVTSTVGPALDDASFRSCAVAAANATRFPSWSRDRSKVTTVRYPFVFAH